jgi:hypothetical protein
LKYHRAVDEKRQHKRVNIALPVVAGGSIPCKLLDLSSTGARLSSERTLPDAFYVMFGPEVKRWCSVMWRRRDQVGVKFVTEPVQAPSQLILRVYP